MQTVTLIVENIEILKNANNKINLRKRLSSDERGILEKLLNGLPESEMLLSQQFPLNEQLQIKILDIEESWPQIEKWINLFNSLPKKTSFTGVHAMWIDAESDNKLWKGNVIIEVSFIPTLSHSKRKDNKSTYLSLKIDGTALFKFNLVEDAKAFPELYLFNGSWKEAYLLVVKTLQQGWPQTKFPEELEPLLKK
jgi:hypothetical protein